MWTESESRPRPKRSLAMEIADDSPSLVWDDWEFDASLSQPLSPPSIATPAEAMDCPEFRLDRSAAPPPRPHFQCERMPASAMETWNPEEAAVEQISAVSTPGWPRPAHRK